MSECQSAHPPFFVGGIAGQTLPSLSERTADFVARMALALAGAHGCLVCSTDGTRHKLRTVGSRGLPAVPGCSCEEQADSAIAAALRGDWSTSYDPALSTQPGYCVGARGARLASRLVLPLLVDGSPVGIMQLYAEAPRAFSNDAVPGLLRQAALAATAIENARLHDRAVVLFDLANTLSSTLDMAQVGNLIAATVARALGAKGCTVRSLDRMARRLDLVGAYGLSRKYLWDKGPVLASQSIADALEGRPTAIYDVAGDPRVQYPQAAVAEGISSIASIPMVVKGVVTGVLRVYTAQPHEFSPEEMAFLCAAAGVAGAALENARLYDGIRHDFEILMDEIVFMRRAARAVGGSKEA